VLASQFMTFEYFGCKIHRASPYEWMRVVFALPDLIDFLVC